MNASSWQLDGNSARLASTRCSATIDLTHPADGLRVQFNGENPSSRLQMLGFTFGEREPPIASRMDAYVRGTDIVATYEETTPQHVRLQAYWRRLDAAEFCPTDAAGVAIAIELILSANTSLLDSDPQVTIASFVSPIAEVQSLRLSADGNLPTNRASAEPTGSFIARLPGDQISYVELLHPQDYGSSTLEVANNAQPLLQSSHRLFQQRLEKGVILRARVRASLVERPRDESIALAAYRQFATTEPPLTV